MKFSQVLLLFCAFVTAIQALALAPALEATSGSSNAIFKRKGGDDDDDSSSGGDAHYGYASYRGHGIQPQRYGSDSYYGGGAHWPYRSGHKSSKHHIKSNFLGSRLAAVWFPGVWDYGAYCYTFPGTYTYRNDTTNANETHLVICLCSKHLKVCSCDSNTNQKWIDNMANNVTISRLAVIDGTETLVINGSLPNGTKISTKHYKNAAAPSLRQGLVEMGGVWLVVATVGYMVWLI